MPSDNVHESTYTLEWPGVLSSADSSREHKRMDVQSPLSVGLFAGKWCSYAATPDLPHDQREEDGGALVCTSLPLKKPLEILGAPIVELTLSANRSKPGIPTQWSCLAQNEIKHVPIAIPAATIEGESIRCDRPGRPLRMTALT